MNKIEFIMDAGFGRWKDIVTMVSVLKKNIVKVNLQT
jgi:hypothetical protein